MANPKTMELPVLPLRGMLVFPGTVLHFDIARPRSIAALEQCMTGKQKLLLLTQKREEDEEPKPEDLYTVGTVVNVRQVMNLPGENIRVLVEGEVRALVQDFQEKENYLQATVQISKDRIVRSNEGKAMVRTAQDLFEEYAKSSQRISQDMVEGLRTLEKPGEIADLLAAHILQKWQEKHLVILKNRQ